MNPLDGPVEVPAQTPDWQMLVLLGQLATSDARKLRSSAPGTQLADGTALAGGGIEQLGASTLAALAQARLTEVGRVSAEGQYQVDRVDASGAYQVGAVNNAGTAALGSLAGAVAQGQGYATQALTYRNDAAGYAAQAQFAGYASSSATYAAWGGPAGKVNGTHLVKADETKSGRPWAYRVAGGAVADSWGVVLLNAAGGLDLLGPLRSTKTTNHDVLTVAAGNGANKDFLLTKFVGGVQGGGDGRPNEVLSMGYNVNPGGGRLDAAKHAFRLGMEQYYYPFAGRRWAEMHWEMTFENGFVSRPISMEADVDRTDGSNASGKYLRMRIEGDTINFNTPGGQNGLMATLQRTGMLMEAGGYDTLRSNETILYARNSAQQQIRLVSAYDSYWRAVIGQAPVGVTAVQIGDYNEIVNLARRVRIGNEAEPGTALHIGGNGPGGIQEMVRLSMGNGQVDDGICITAYNGGNGLMGKLQFEIGPGGPGRATLYAGNTAALVGHQTGDSEIPTAGAGMVQKSASGTRLRLVLHDDGSASAVAA